MARRGRDRTPANLEKIFGRVLQEMRTERGLSQEQLGLDSGYHPTYISQLERGLKTPSLRTILNLTTTLGVPAAELVRLVEAEIARRSK